MAQKHEAHFFTKKYNSCKLCQASVLQSRSKTSMHAEMQQTTEILIQNPF